MRARRVAKDHLMNRKRTGRNRIRNYMFVKLTWSVLIWSSVKQRFFGFCGSKLIIMSSSHPAQTIRKFTIAIPTTFLSCISISNGRRIVKTDIVVVVAPVSGVRWRNVAHLPGCIRKVTLSF